MSGFSEGAPIPFPRQARRHAASLIVRTLANAPTHGSRGGAGRKGFPPRGRFNLVFFPFQVHPPTVSASPVESAVRVIVRVLIEGYLPHGMFPTEHVPTVPAMVASLEESEGILADGSIADGGLLVGFPMIAVWRTGDLGEIEDQRGVL